MSYTAYTVYKYWNVLLVRTFPPPRLMQSLLPDKIDWPAACGRVDHTVNANRYHKRELANIKLWAKYSTKNEAWLDINRTANTEWLAACSKSFCVLQYLKNAFLCSNIRNLGRYNYPLSSTKSRSAYLFGISYIIVINHTRLTQRYSITHQCLGLYKIWIVYSHYICIATPVWGVVILP